MKNFQISGNYQNLVYSVVFDVHQVKFGSCPQKTVPVGLIISSFSVGPLGFEQTFETLEMVLIRPQKTPERALFRLYRPCHIRLYRPYHTTILTIGHNMIRLSKLWVGPDHTVLTVDGAVYLPYATQVGLIRAGLGRSPNPG